MTDNQTHVAGEVKPVPLFDKIIRTVNSSAEIQSLLYDLGLLPEQTMGDPLQWARTGSIALELAERDEQIRALRIQVKQADERGDDAMRRAHGAEAQIEALAEAQAFLMTELAAAKEKYAAAQHAADCLEAKCNALGSDYNRRPENEPIGMLLDFLSTRPRNIVRVELAGLWPGEELTLGHLCKFTRSEVLRFPNLGKKSLREIEEYFRPRGVWWRGEQ